MLPVNLLPPPQYYIVMGIVGTACAIVSSRLADEGGRRLPPGVRVFTMLSLLAVATVATIPVVFPLFELIDQAQAGSVELDPFEPTSHGCAVLLLYALLFVWCERVISEETEGGATGAISQ